MGKIKKILENELVGGTQSTDVYPITSTKAVYDENNVRLDDILKPATKESEGLMSPEDKNNIELVQTELDGKVDKASVVQESGNSEELVMSQKAVSDKLTELDKQIRRVRIFGSSFEGSDVWIDSPMSLKKGFSYLIESTAKYERSSNLFLFLSKEKNRQDENVIVSNLIIIPANNTTGITTWIADNDYDTAYIYLYQSGGNEVTLRITELSQQEILA